MIYFIQESDDGDIKIGYSDNPERRIRELQTGSPKQLNLLAVIEGEKSDETELHKLFKKLNTRGEWFSPDTEIFLYIDSLSPNTFKTIECPICEFHYLPNIPKDNLAHKQKHKLILKGAFPYSVREIMKRPQNSRKRETNSALSQQEKLAIAYSWWARVRESDIPDEAFEIYMINRLEYLDSEQCSDFEKCNILDEQLKLSWGDYI